VGRENVHLQVISEGGVYVRKPGEKQAWLAGGQLVVGGEPKDWLANRIVNLPRAQIARAVIRHPNGDVITVENTSTSSTDKPFEVTGLPPEKKLADKFYPTDIGRALEDFTILDAREANKIPFPKNRTVVATFDSVDGLVVRMQVTTVEEDRWATLGAEATSSSDVQVQRAAKEIAARVNGWAFRIPEFEAVHIVKPLAKIVEPATSKPPEK
jgi:hypothetical protein